MVVTNSDYKAPASSFTFIILGIIFDQEESLVAATLDPGELTILTIGNLEWGYHI